MFKNYLSMLFSIINIKGDLIEIEIETGQHGNICPNPTLYRSTLEEQFKHYDDLGIYCQFKNGLRILITNNTHTKDDIFSDFLVPEYMQSTVKLEKVSSDLPLYDLWGTYVLDDDFDRTVTNRTEERYIHLTTNIFS